MLRTRQRRLRRSWTATVPRNAPSTESSWCGHPLCLRKDNAQLLPVTEAVFSKDWASRRRVSPRACEGSRAAAEPFAPWPGGKEGRGRSKRGLSMIERGLDGRKAQPVGQPGQNLRMNRLVNAGQRPETGQLPPVHAGLIHDDPEGIGGDEAH